MSRTRCTLCKMPVPILASKCVADGNAGLLHVECAKSLRAAGWETGQPMPPRELVRIPGPQSEIERHFGRNLPEGVTPADHLGRLEAEFEAKGGRDVELAERIDALREYLCPDPPSRE